MDLKQKNQSNKKNGFGFLGPLAGQKCMSVNAYTQKGARKKGARKRAPFPEMCSKT